VAGLGELGALNEFEWEKVLMSNIVMQSAVLKTPRCGLPLSAPKYSITTGMGTAAGDATWPLKTPADADDALTLRDGVLAATT
jgi:hypothetical protein